MEEVPTNITKLLKLTYILKIANEGSDTLLKRALETSQVVSVTTGHG